MLGLVLVSEAESLKRCNSCNDRLIMPQVCGTDGKNISWIQVLNLFSGKTYAECMVGCNGIKVQCRGECPCRDGTGAKRPKRCNACDSNSRILDARPPVCGTDGKNISWIQVLWF